MSARGDVALEIKDRLAGALYTSVGFVNQPFLALYGTSFVIAEEQVAYAARGLPNDPELHARSIALLKSYHVPVWTEGFIINASLR